MKKLFTAFIAFSLLTSTFILTFATEYVEWNVPAPETKEEKLIFERYGEEVYYEYGYGKLCQLDENGNYPVNSQGMTYGPHPLVELVGENPELVSALGENDVLGYVLASDLELPIPEGEESVEINLYSSEMEVIDIYIFADGNTEVIPPPKIYTNTEGMSLEEAQDYIANMGRATESATAIQAKISAWETTFDGYEIHGEPYVKLRDLVIALAETEHKMTLIWSAEEDRIYLKRGISDYAEMTSYAVEGDRIASPSLTNLLLDDGDMYLSMYLIDGSNYVNLNEFTYFLIAK